MLSIFSARKSFQDRWIGHPALNAAGLHTWRLRAATKAAGLRRAQTLWRRDDAARALMGQGIVVIENFLPDKEFSRLQKEAFAAAARAEEETPPVAGTRKGFGPKREHDWGFDRSDGSTLNRFINIDDAAMPGCAALARNKRLRNLSRAVTGMAVPRKFNWIYQTFHGDEISTPDVQRKLHRDTFFGAMKYWFFVEPVRPDDGPFEYVPGSHLLTPERMDWEAETARAGCTAVHKKPADRTAAERVAIGGSFRLDERELGGLNLPVVQSYPVAENTLVMANIFGFHRRGQATPGTRRMAIYGNRRPYLPFSLLGR